MLLVACSSDISVSKGRSKHVKWVVLHVISLAQYARRNASLRPTWVPYTPHRTTGCVVGSIEKYAPRRNPW